MGIETDVEMRNVTEQGQVVADFKGALSEELVARIGGEIADVAGSFDRQEFQQRACAGLGDLELKAREAWIADALAATMPEEAEESARIIRAVLDNGGLQGWASMPVNTYVASEMLERPGVALPLLATLTHRYTAEFAIRAFIETHYQHTMNYLRDWTSHPDEHVRRLVSEGTRPRLPWAAQLKGFITDPTPALELIEDLVNDPSLYVRRSVANHLNDISKDHPALALETGRRWSQMTTQGEYVVRHGLGCARWLNVATPRRWPSLDSTPERRSSSPNSAARRRQWSLVSP